MYWLSAGSKVTCPLFAPEDAVKLMLQAEIAIWDAMAENMNINIFINVFDIFLW